MPPVLQTKKINKRKIRREKWILNARTEQEALPAAANDPGWILRAIISIKRLTKDSRKAILKMMPILRNPGNDLKPAKPASL